MNKLAIMLILNIVDISMANAQYPENPVTPNSPVAKTYDINIGGYNSVDCPSNSYMINTGDTVVWHADAEVPGAGDSMKLSMQLTSTDGLFRDTTVDHGSTYTYTFDNPGRFTFQEKMEWDVKYLFSKDHQSASCSQTI